MINQNLLSVIEARRVIDGPDDKLRAVSYVKYPWAPMMFEAMCANNWDFKEVPLARDRMEFLDLTKGEQTAFMRALAFLSNLDSIQVDNLAENVGHIITDPTIRECIYRQEFEEVIHVKAYSAMIESIFPDDPLAIYNLYNVVPQLGAKNDYIINQSKEVSTDPTSVNKVKAVVSNVALEGIFFFNGFAEIYAVGRNHGKMQGSVDQVKYIQRDEIMHTGLFANIFNTIRTERPELFTPTLIDEYKQILFNAARLEADWGVFCIEDGLPGFNEDIARAFPEHRADECALALGLGPVFGTANPIDWFYSYSRVNDKQKNFFETKPQTYQETKLAFRSRRTQASSAAPVHVNGR